MFSISVLGSNRRAFCPRLMHDIFETPDFQGFCFADSPIMVDVEGGGIATECSASNP